MALSRVTTWSSGQTLTASALNGEFNNVLNNALSLISPLTGNLDINGYSLPNLARGAVGSPSLYFTGDSNTGMWSSQADSVDITAGGVAVASFYTRTSGVNSLAFRPGLTGTGPSIEAFGSDTNVPLKLVPKGTGYVILNRGQSVGEVFRPSLTFDGEPALDSGVMSMVTGWIDLVAGGRRALSCQAVANATNYLVINPSISGQPVTVQASNSLGSEADLQIGASGHQGRVRVASAFVPAGWSSGTPSTNALFRENLIKAWVSFGRLGAVASIYDSFNITSVSYGGSAGVGTITWDNDFAATTYAVVGTGEAETSGRPLVMAGALGHASGTFDVNTWDIVSGALENFQKINLVAVGDQT